MPTIHISKESQELINELYVSLVTQTQSKVKMSTVIELALLKGITNVTAEDLKENERK